MFSTENWPSASSWFTTYASVTASVALAKAMANDLIPQLVRDYASSALRYFFKPRSKELTLVIDESNGITRNQIFEAAEVYLGTKICPKTERLKISKTPKEKTISIRLEKNEEVVESFEGVDLKWRFILAEPDKSTNNIYPMRLEKKSFELTFHQRDKDLILDSYIPSVIDKAIEVREEQRILKMYTLNNSIPFEEIKWDAVNLEHPATFDTLAMEPSLKHSIIEDLDRFVRRKDFYKRVGRAWKRGYLLYGPPGTGKSSLVAAMANHLKFDVYDLQLGNVIRDSDLRKLLLSTGNRSILVIEDIDCSLDLPDRQSNDADAPYQASASRGAGRRDKTDLASGKKNMLTLSGLLNFIDGLWSSCGDERIIIFTTNHKERLDPALLRPGRMDMHIHMSYCTFYGFKLLASNYLGITGEHRLYGEIEDLIRNAHITPARVAEEFMKSEKADMALGGLVTLLKRKQCNRDADGDEDADEIEALEMKKLKTDKGKAKNKAKKTAGPRTRRKPARRN